MIVYVYARDTPTVSTGERFTTVCLVPTYYWLCAWCGWDRHTHNHVLVGDWYHSLPSPWSQPDFPILYPAAAAGRPLLKDLSDWTTVMPPVVLEKRGRWSRRVVTWREVALR